jgi:Tol biopolymer transport system component
MRSIGILPLVAMAALLGCGGTTDWLRGPSARTDYNTPLTNDTSIIHKRVWTSSGPDSLFSPSYGMMMPDGAGMATTDRLTGDPAIFDLASGIFRRFPINGAPYDSGVAIFSLPSPDGSRVAVAWLPQPQIRVVDVATGTTRTIATADTNITSYLHPVAWTPQGDSVFASLSPSNSQANAEIVLIPAAGGAQRLVHTFPNSAVPHRTIRSPDGRWLLYDHVPTRQQRVRSDIYIIDVLGGGARPLLSHPADDRLVGWLPGTDVVLFSSDRSGTTDLWSMRVANGYASAQPRRVRSGFFQSEGAGFGAGALFYSVRTGASGIAVVSMDPQSGALYGPASPPLAHLSAVPRSLTWSPDGQSLASPVNARGSNRITVHSMKTGESRAFWLDEGVVPFRVQWAADGKTLLVRAGKAGMLEPMGAHHFLRFDPMTGQSSRLFAEDEPDEVPPLWRFLVTPDGRSIVLRQQRTLADGGTEMKLVLRSLKDGSERELYRTSGYIPEFSLSADGTQLAFMQQVWQKTDSLFVMRMNGSAPLRYVASWGYDVVSLLGWLPSGNSLLAARLTEDRAREEILRLDLSGTSTVVGISPFVPSRGSRRAQGYHRSRLELSPAANRLAHSVHDRGEELWRMEGLHSLFGRESPGRR